MNKFNFSFKNKELRLLTTIGKKAFEFIFKDFPLKVTYISLCYVCYDCDEISFHCVLP